jgi:hypothetical protein
MQPGRPRAVGRSAQDQLKRLRCGLSYRLRYDLDELLTKVWKEPGFFLAHPRTIAAFGRECTRRGVPPPTVTLFGTPFLTWRGVPLVPSDKVKIGGTNGSETSKILLVRAGEKSRGSSASSSPVFQARWRRAFPCASWASIAKPSRPILSRSIVRSPSRPRMRSRCSMMWRLGATPITPMPTADPSDASHSGQDIDGSRLDLHSRSRGA